MTIEETIDDIAGDGAIILELAHRDEYPAALARLGYVIEHLYEGLEHERQRLFFGLHQNTFAPVAAAAEA